MTTSRTTDSVIAFIRRRAEAGLAKYGQTMDRSDLDPAAWVTHLEEELADGLQYCERVEQAMELLASARGLFDELPETLRPRFQSWIDAYDQAFQGSASQSVGRGPSAFKGFGFELDRLPFGWLMLAPPGKEGVPVTAFEKANQVLGGNESLFLDVGIAHHYRVAGYSDQQVIAALATQEKAQQWRTSIEKSIWCLSPEQRWWYGTNVGASSAALFAVLSSGEYREAAAKMAKGAVPADKEDLGRCLALLDAFPEWEARLSEVADAYAKTAWPAIIARWADLRAAMKASSSYLKVKEILEECNRPTHE